MAKRSSRQTRKTRKQRGGVAWGFTGAYLPAVSGNGQINTAIQDVVVKPGGYITSYSSKGLIGGKRNGNSNNSNNSTIGNIVNESRNNNSNNDSTYNNNNNNTNSTYNLSNNNNASIKTGPKPIRSKFLLNNSNSNSNNSNNDGTGSLVNSLNSNPTNDELITPQDGGRYSFDLSDTSVPGLSMVKSIPCEASTPNPMNHKGGAMSPAYFAPTAGYANTVSSETVGGVPIQLQVPYDAKAMNPACIKGGRKNRKSRKTRKNRKMSKKTRKH